MSLEQYTQEHMVDRSRRYLHGEITTQGYRRYLIDYVEHNLGGDAAAKAWARTIQDMSEGTLLVYARTFVLHHGRTEGSAQ